VYLVTVREQPEDFPATAAAAYLAVHGVPALLSTLPAGKTPIGETLPQEAGRVDAAYIVLAYGHTRIRELLVGGVTRWMLGSSSVPLFLAH
jgi:nucleotide-binding universal stress UspA family protein